MKRNTIKFLGVIALAALIGLTFFACDNGTQSSSSSGSSSGSTDYASADKIAKNLTKALTNTSNEKAIPIALTKIRTGDNKTDWSGGWVVAITGEATLKSSAQLVIDGPVYIDRGATLSIGEGVSGVRIAKDGLLFVCPGGTLAVDGYVYVGNGGKLRIDSAYYWDSNNGYDLDFSTAAGYGSVDATDPGAGFGNIKTTGLVDEGHVVIEKGGRLELPSFDPSNKTTGGDKLTYPFKNADNIYDIRGIQFEFQAGSELFLLGAAYDSDASAWTGGVPWPWIGTSRSKPWPNQPETGADLEVVEGSLILTFTEYAYNGNTTECLYPYLLLSRNSKLSSPGFNGGAQSGPIWLGVDSAANITVTVLGFANPSSIKHSLWLVPSASLPKEVYRSTAAATDNRSNVSVSLVDGAAFVSYVDDGTTSISSVTVKETFDSVDPLKLPLQ